MKFIVRGTFNYVFSFFLAGVSQVKHISLTVQVNVKHTEHIYANSTV